MVVSLYSALVQCPELCHGMQPMEEHFLQFIIVVMNMDGYGFSCKFRLFLCIRYKLFSGASLSGIRF